LSRSQLIEGGGNESQIPKTFSRLLRPKGWTEARMSAALVIDDQTVQNDTPGEIIAALALWPWRRLSAADIWYYRAIAGGQVNGHNCRQGSTGARARQIWDHFG
jgi:hypothetical protein